MMHCCQEMSGPSGESDVEQSWRSESEVESVVIGFQKRIDLGGRAVATLSVSVILSKHTFKEDSACLSTPSRVIPGWPLIGR